MAVRQLDAAATAEIRITNVQEDLETLLREQLDEESAIRMRATAPGTYEPDPALYDPTLAALATLEKALVLARIRDSEAVVADIRRAHERWEISARSTTKRGDAQALRRRTTESKFQIEQFRSDTQALRSRLKALKRKIRTS